MLSNALIAYIHYISIITLIATLIMELMVFRKELSNREASLLGRADRIYGLAAIMVLVTGTLRVLIFDKGLGYYFSNYIFITKLTLFAVVGLLSIYPTIVFIRWRNALKEGNDILVPDKEFNRIHRILRVEVVLAFFIPLLAALMARGFGFIN